MQYLKNRVFNLIKRKLLDLWGNLTSLRKGLGKGDTLN